MACSIGEGVRPLPFVLVNEDGGFSVNPEACQRLEKIKGKLVVIVVAGLYRTGKSFLLNLLVKHAPKKQYASSSSSTQQQEQGFEVGGTVQACTKGIWMWGEPIVLEDGTNVLFLDTEGLGSVDREQTHDTRIFALALLLASNFIYNSRGVIDGNAIEDLSLVVNLSKHIQTSASSSAGGSAGDDLHSFFPSFLWVVRDFTLQLQENGKKISSKQYLEAALKPQGGFSEDAVAKDQIRLLLTDFFRQRDCVTLVRPVDDEQLLRALPQVPYEDLRSEFRSSFETMLRRLFEKAKPKMLYGKMLNGLMFVKLVQSYVEALNSGKAPVISSAWNRVVEAQCEDALQDAIQSYKKEIHTCVKPFTSVEDFDLRRENDQEEEADVQDFGQGNNAMFDEYGNLRTIKIQDALSASVSASASAFAVDEEQEAIDAMANASLEEEEQLNQLYKDKTSLPCQEDTLAFIHKKCKQNAKKKLQDIIDHGYLNEDFDSYMDKFRHGIQQIYDTLKQQNAAASMTYCRFVLEKLSRHHTVPSDEETEQLSSEQLFEQTKVYLTSTLDQFHQDYYKKAIGPSQDAAYCEFMSQKVLDQVIQRTEQCNTSHINEVRDLEVEMNQMSVQVAVAQGQVSAMRELLIQQQQKCDLSVKEAEQRAQNEIISVRSTLDFKTNELEHVLNHNATLKRLADTAQQGQDRATEFASTQMSGIMAGYLIKQQPPSQTAGAGGSTKAKWYQRYFVLRGTQLTFYDTKEDFERSRADKPPMEVRGAHIEDNFAVPEAFSITFGDNNCFPLHLHAKSVEIKKEWVDRLRRAAAGRPGSAGASPPRYNPSGPPPPMSAPGEGAAPPPNTAPYQGNYTSYVQQW